MAISSINIQDNNINQQTFKGKYTRTEQGNSYYKTNSGTVAGAIVAVPAGLTWLQKRSLPTTEEEVMTSANKIKDIFMKGLKGEDAKFFSEGFDKGIKEASSTAEVKEAWKLNKKLKSRAIPGAIIAAMCSLGCGMLVDKLRNNKAKEAADTVGRVGLNNAIMHNDNISISRKGRAYYESSEGLKWGALLGAGCGIANAALYSAKPIQYLTKGLKFAVGGLIMGAITDACTNKSARKHS